MELNNFKKKMKLLFDRFTNDNYHMSSYYSTALVKYFENAADKSIEKQLLDTSFFSDLVMGSLNNVEVIVCKAIKTLILEMLGLLVRNELQFCKLVTIYGNNLLLTKLCIIHKDNTNSSPNLAKAFYKLPAGKLSHSSGVMLLTEQKVWERILTPDIHTKPASVAKAAYSFISSLILKLNEIEEEKFLIEVLNHIVSPVIRSEYQAQNHSMDIDDEESRTNSIQTYIETLLDLFSENNLYKQPSIAVHLLDKYFLIHSYLHSVIRAIRDDCLLEKITDLLFRFCFAAFRNNYKRTSKSDYELLNEILSIYINILKMLLRKRNMTVISKFLVNCLIFWSKIGGKLISSTFERDGQTIDIRIQFMLLLVDPIICYASDCNKENSLEAFHLKYNALTTEHIFKTHCMLRSLILEIDNVKNTCLLNLKELFKLQKHLNVTQAGIIYQALFYALDSHVKTDKTGGLILNECSNLKLEDLKIISWVFDLMLCILKEHQINWYENIEIISFQSTLVNLLKQNILPSKLLLQAMNLIDWNIKNFLSPDLTLLVESKNGSTLNEVGKLISVYIESQEWEVRDSAFQILLSCLEVSFIKYVPLQKLILENRLIHVTVTKIFDDPEYYVQQTALRCLAVATKIEAIWQEVVQFHPHICTQLLFILKNHQEGIIRKEVISVITEIYANQKLSQSFVLHLYRLMGLIVFEDLYWEVHLAALGFWRQVIQKSLCDRSVVNGKFPSVTFCKEKRKIVVLNTNEILKQLSNFMNFLSSIGCLTVLSECLQEGRNLKVMEQAYNVSKYLTDILDYYKFNGVLNDNTMSVDNDIKNIEGMLENADSEIAEYTDMFTSENMLFRDTVIDSILATNTVNLIDDISKSYISVKKEFEEDSIKSVKVVNPNDFINLFKQTDYISLFKEKENWNCSSLESVLDEILNLDIKQEDAEFHC